MKDLTDNQKVKWINESWHSGNIESWTKVRKYITKASYNSSKVTSKIGNLTEWHK